jgi:cytoskeletal protein CcmA (bactofilin family)
MFLRRRGSIATVMVLAGLMLAVGLTMATTTIFNLSSTTREGNSACAEDLAESVLQEAIARLSLDSTYGEGAPPPPIVVSDPDLPAGSEGRLTFSTTGPEAYSTNNRSGSRDSGWGGRPVPDRKVHLVGTGRYAGVERRVEMMVHIPKFPLVMGTEGGIVAEDSLVGSFKDPSQITIQPNGALDYDKDQLDKGDLVSNGLVQLTDNTRVTGTVRATAGLVVSPDSSVDGEVLAPYERANIPNVDVTQYDPALDPNIYYEERTAASLTGDNTFNGVVRYAGSLSVGGQLQLDNAVLYVDGNFSASGGVHGVGAIFVTGNADVGGGNRLSGIDNVSLLVKGTTRILGDVSQASVFQGMVYSQGNFMAENMNLIGSFISNSNSAQAFHLKDCKLFHTGLTSSPTMVHSVDVVLARFGPKAYQATFDISDRGYLRGFPVATYLTYANTVRDVLGLDGGDMSVRASRWDVSDPCVLHFEFTGGQWMVTQGHWGRYGGGEGGGPLPEATYLGPTTFDDFVSTFVASWDPAQISGFMDDDGSPPPILSQAQLTTALNTMMTQVIQAASQPRYIFQIDANKFLVDEKDKFRVLYRREL